MLIKIEKRNGKLVPFNKLKIEQAIEKAMAAIASKENKSLAHTIAVSVEAEASKVAAENKTLSVFAVEDLIFALLVKAGHEDIAKAYTEFKAVQAFKRKSNTTDDSILGLIRCTNEDLINENSNKDAFLVSTQRDLMAGEISKDIARRKLIPADIVQAHDSGAIHFHKQHCGF